MITALLVGLLVGAAIGAVAWDILFTEPARRERARLANALVRREFRDLNDRSERLLWRANHAEELVRARTHLGTPYIQRAPLPAELDEALVDVSDNDRWSRKAELRAV